VQKIHPVVAVAQLPRRRDGNGRINTIEMNNPMSGISKEAQGSLEMAEETMNRAMTRLLGEQSELTAEYREACRFVPELVEKESNQRWFLR
jgi:hypothetical protein